MKKIIYALIVLAIVINVNAFQYIGENKLCIIHNNNTVECLNQYDNSSIDGDITMSLYSDDYEFGVSSVLDLQDVIIELLGVFMIAYLIIALILYMKRI